MGQGKKVRVRPGNQSTTVMRHFLNDMLQFKDTMESRTGRAGIFFRRHARVSKDTREAAEEA
jgi:hypothetical protein